MSFVASLKKLANSGAGKKLKEKLTQMAKKAGKVAVSQAKEYAKDSIKNRLSGSSSPSPSGDETVSSFGRHKSKKVKSDIKYLKLLR